jgi:formylglycine-generating enzyme required for sulfatase activity
MKDYSLKKAVTVCIIVTVLGVFFTIMISACGTQKPVVPDTEEVPEPVKEKPVVAVSKTPPEEKAKPPQLPSKPLIEMVSVGGGTFRMGNPGNSRRRDSSTLDIEWPRHNVTLNGFSIGKFEVTQDQYFEVTGTKPSSHMKSPDSDDPDGWKKLPVESITWYDTLVFCNKLSIKEKLKPVYSIDGSVNPDDWGDPPTRRSTVWDSVVMDIHADGYRLPTEAEWEYAARGGAESKGFNYAGSNTPAHVAWFSVIVNGMPVGTIHEVGKKQPNELGLFDMSGNVMEWCWDWLDNYSADPQNNPVGPSKGLYRVIRGGGWSIRDTYSRLSYRHNNQAHYFGINLGFRVARSK